MESAIGEEAAGFEPMIFQDMKSKRVNKVNQLWLKMKNTKGEV